MSKQTVVFDFDGVIHSYTSGWKGEEVVADPPVPGIKEALKAIHEAGYEVAVVSTRCASREGIDAVKCYLHRNSMLEYVDKICKEKPPAIVYIDDRAICFDGHPETLLGRIENFVPWNKQSDSLMHHNRKAEIDEVIKLCEKIGYGNVMDIASGLWAKKQGAPGHVPSVMSYLTEEGKAVATDSLAAMISQLDELGY